MFELRLGEAAANVLLHRLKLDEDGAPWPPVHRAEIAGFHMAPSAHARLQNEAANGGAVTRMAS